MSDPDDFRDHISDAMGNPGTAFFDGAEAEILAKQYGDITENLKSTVLKNSSDDYQFVRDMLKDAIGKCGGMIPSMVNLAKQAESASMYDATSKVFKVFIDLNNALLDTGSKVDKLADKSKPPSPTSVPALPTPSSAAPSTNEPIVFEGDVATFLNGILEKKKQNDLDALVIES